jgi:hypothetical protein
MIKPTSTPYEITVYNVQSRDLHPDGTPKSNELKPVTKLMRFPQDVIDRIHVMTDNVRFRRFVKGWPLTNIDWAWLFICFESTMPYRLAAMLRETSGLTMDQWSFYTFDEEKLAGSRNGGSPPDINVMSFSGMAVASKAMRALGSPNLLADLRLWADESYFLFAKYEHEAQDEKHVPS